MTLTAQYKVGAIITMVCSFTFLLLLAREGSVQPPPAACARSDTASSDLDVLDHPPTYRLKALQWTYGTKIAVIPQGQQFWICEERRIGFFGAKQRWLRIWWNGTDGWTYSGDVQSALFRHLYAFWRPAAFAQPSPGSPQLANPLVGVIIGSFICIVLGMVAKNVFDLFTGRWVWSGTKHFVVRLVPPLVVTPMVLKSVVDAIDPRVFADKGFLFFLLLAFQNGFFWQDILGVISDRGQPQGPSRDQG